jgi:hypothetical protein
MTHLQKFPRLPHLCVDAVVECRLHGSQAALLCLQLLGPLAGHLQDNITSTDDTAMFSSGSRPCRLIMWRM